VLGTFVCILGPDSYRWEFVSQNAGNLRFWGPIAINHTNLASSNINPYGLLSSEKIGNIKCNYWCLLQ